MCRRALPDRRLRRSGGEMRTALLAVGLARLLCGGVASFAVACARGRAAATKTRAADPSPDAGHRRTPTPGCVRRPERCVATVDCTPVDFCSVRFRCRASSRSTPCGEAGRTTSGRWERAALILMATVRRSRRFRSPSRWRPTSSSRCGARARPTSGSSGRRLRSTRTATRATRRRSSRGGLVLGPSKVDGRIWTGHSAGRRRVARGQGLGAVRCVGQLLAPR